MIDLKDRNTCIKLLKKFLDEKYPNKNIETQLKEFCNKFDFRDLNGKYGSSSLNTHADGTYLAGIIYEIVWGNWENNGYSLPCVDGAYKSKLYGSDTMNPVRNSDYYQTIGNFMVLPSGKANNNLTTINKYKYCCFRDDLFKFINKMKEIYNNYIEPSENQKDFPENKNQPLWKELIDNNALYFEKINTFEEFKSRNILDGWEDLNSADTDKIEKFIGKRAEKICDILMRNM